MPDTPDGDASLADVLNAQGLIEHLPILLRAHTTTSELVGLHVEGRPQLLQRLKEVGITALPVRQAIANAIGKFRRHGLLGAEQAEVAAGSGSSSADSPASAPPGSVRINMRCVGTLGGDNCPGNGRLRQTTVYTAATTVQALYAELAAARGYTQAFANVRVSHQSGRGILDSGEAAALELHDGMSLSFIGPNNGG